GARPFPVRRWRFVMSEHQDVLRLEGLRKVYTPGTPQEQEVLRGIDLRLSRGELTALIGPSGSGKSTLLNVIGLLDSPSAGELYLMGQPTRTLDDEARTRPQIGRASWR